MTDLERLVEREGIQISISPGAGVDSVVTSPFTSWTITLTYEKRKYVTPFFTHGGVGPKLADVIFNLCCEVNSVDSTQGRFELWAERFGYNIDSRAAHAIWQTIVQTSPKLKQFFGMKCKEFLRAGHNYQCDPFSIP